MENGQGTVGSKSASSHVAWLEAIFDAAITPLWLSSDLCRPGSKLATPRYMTTHENQSIARNLWSPLEARSINLVFAESVLQNYWRGVAFFTCHVFLRLVKSQDSPSKIWKTTGDAHLEEFVKFYFAYLVFC
jgi:hypothetical protein